MGGKSQSPAGAWVMTGVLFGLALWSVVPGQHLEGLGVGGGMDLTDSEGGGKG